MNENRQDVYHHYDNDGARINVKVERNSRGYNFEATVTGAKTVDEAIQLLTAAEYKLKALFSEPSKPIEVPTPLAVAAEAISKNKKEK